MRITYLTIAAVIFNLLVAGIFAFIPWVLGLGDAWVWTAAIAGSVCGWHIVFTKQTA